MFNDEVTITEYQNDDKIIIIKTQILPYEDFISIRISEKIIDKHTGRKEFKEVHTRIIKNNELSL